MPGTTALIVDTATLYFRAYYGLPTTLTDPAGRPVNAVHGLLDMLATLINAYSPAELVCAWDDDWRPAWRVELIETYKAHRVAEVTPGPTPDVEGVADELNQQVPWILDCLAATGICVAGAAGYEADDVLGTLAERYRQAGTPVVVVSGDRDLFQLVRPGVQVAYVARGVAQHELIDDQWLVSKYGIAGSQYVDFAILRGDPSDGLPGVAGIGEKTAASLLAAHRDLPGALVAAADPAVKMAPKVRANLLAADDYLARAAKVVATAQVPLGELDAQLAPGRADLAACERLAEEHKVAGPMSRLLAALGEMETGY